MEDLRYILKSFGPIHSELDQDDLNPLSEEILTLEQDPLVNITCKAIQHGKIQILNCVLENKVLDKDQINLMKRSLEKYVNDDPESDPESDDSHSDSDSDDDSDSEDHTLDIKYDSKERERIGRQMEDSILAAEKRLKGHNASSWIKKNTGRRKNSRRRLSKR